MVPTRRSIGALLSAAALSVATYLIVLPPVAQAAGPLISQSKPATASSVENGGTPAANAFDGNTDGWASELGELVEYLDATAA